MKSKFLLPMFVCAAGVITNTQSADWPRWRGSDLTDHCLETGLLKQWPAGGPKKLWTSREVGLGYSSHAIAGGTLYTMGLEGDSEQIIALDAASGKKLWATTIGARFGNKWGDGPRATPTLEGGHVYAMGGNGDLACLDAKSGRMIWKTSMADLGGKTPGWGYCESVLVDDGKVICTPGGEMKDKIDRNRGAMAALDKRTGKLIWQSDEWKDGAQYASVVPATIHGVRQYIQLTQANLVGISAKDGRLLWRSDWQGRTAVIPTPIVVGNEVYIASGYGVGCKKVRVGSDWSVKDVWVNKVMKNHHGGVILHDGHLYGYSDGGGWICQSWASGDEVWSFKAGNKDPGSFGKGAIYYANGRFILLEEQTGEVALIDASAKGWKEISRFKLDPQTEQRSKSGKIWTHPVVSGGRLYLRDQELLHCYDVAASR
jgi:outer membrane protein assembly factor BamB